MVLEAFACGVFSLTELSKTQHYSLEENTKEKILDQGLYHFTSKDVAEKIAKDGYFRPTRGRIKNHLGKDKVYMFAGLPDMDNFSKNLPANLNPFVSGNLEFSAVKVNPDEQELSKFKERLQDSAVVYEGRYDIGMGRGNAVELVIDLDENGKCVFREKTQEELQNGYNPSQELMEYVENHKISKRANEFKILYQEIKAGLSSIPNAIPRFYRDYKSKSEKKKAMKEFEPYSFELGVSKGEETSSYHISCDKLEFCGDKKLNRVRIDKTNIETGEVSSQECYMDEHLLNLGEQAAAIYLSKLESAIESNSLNKVNDIYYAGQPMFDIENGNISIGVDSRFNELLKERNLANFLGDIRENSDTLFNEKIKEYYKKHPIKKFLDKRAIKKGKMKILMDRNQIGKYTNEKLESFSLEDSYQDIDETNGFELNKKCDFKYKDGSKYSALIGETVDVDGKRLRKLIVSEESNYLTENAMDTARLPQNYYIDDVDFDKIDKKHLSKYLANLEFDKSEEPLSIEENGFVGRYMGGVILDKKGRIQNKTYDKSLKDKYGREVHIQKEIQGLDMSVYTYDDQIVTQNYSKQDPVSYIENEKKINEKEADEINI